MQPSSSLAPVAPIIFMAIAVAAINWIDLARGKGSAQLLPVRRQRDGQPLLFQTKKRR